jgi:hypothetical protein
MLYDGLARETVAVEFEDTTVNGLPAASDAN